MRCSEQRANAMRAALQSFARVEELSEADLCRMHRRATRNPSPQHALSLPEIVAKKH